MQRLITASGFSTEDFIEDLPSILTQGPFQKLAFVVAVLSYTAGAGLDELIASEPTFPALCELSATGTAITLETPTTKIVLYDENTFGLKPMGYLYGFPECCITWFNHRSPFDEANHRPTMFDGTGYIPCPHCRNKTEEEIVAGINERRVAPLSFPNDDALHELILIAYLRKHGLPIGDNLEGYEEQFDGFNYSAVFANTL